MSGPAYFDTIGYLLNNIMGDISYSGTYTGSQTTTLSSQANINDTSVITVATITNGSTIQISTDNSAEVRTITSVTGAGPFTLNFSTPLTRTHAAAQVVRPITTPFQQTYAVLNSGQGQPSSLTITDYQGPTASAGMRAYSGCCLSELNLKGTVESSAITYDCKGMGWPSAGAVTFSSSPSSVKPQAAWETTVGLNGTVGGAQVKTINDFAISLKRVIQIYYTAQNSQNPYYIMRGKLTASGTLNVVISDDTSQTYLTGNTQPQMQFIISNGLAGASLLSMQVDILQGAYTTSKIQRGNAATEFAVTFDCIANSTNVGYSAGFGPVFFTLQNAVSANGF